MFLLLIKKEKKIFKKNISNLLKVINYYLKNSVDDFISLYDTLNYIYFFSQIISSIETYDRKNIPFKLFLKKKNIWKELKNINLIFFFYIFPNISFFLIPYIFFLIKKIFLNNKKEDHVLISLFPQLKRYIFLSKLIVIHIINAFFSLIFFVLPFFIISFKLKWYEGDFFYNFMKIIFFFLWFFLIAPFFFIIFFGNIYILLIKKYYFFSLIFPYAIMIFFSTFLEKILEYQLIENKKILKNITILFIKIGNIIKFCSTNIFLFITISLSLGIPLFYINMYENYNEDYITIK